MKVLSKYLKKRKAAIYDLLAKPRSKYTPGTYHKLRVEIKKLNALSDLINFCSKNFKRKKTLVPFKQIFRQAGKIRELQIEEALLKKHLPVDSYNNYRNKLKTLRLKEYDVFFTLIDGKMIARLNKKYHVFASSLSEVNKKKVVHYLEKKGGVITEILSQSAVQPEQVHELRKRLKMFDYNRKSLPMEKNSPAHSKNDVLPELIGKWHDQQVIIIRLEKAMSIAAIKARERNELKKLKAKISLESKALFSEIKKAIPASGFLRT